MAFKLNLRIEDVSRTGTVHMKNNFEQQETKTMNV